MIWSSCELREVLAYVHGCFAPEAVPQTNTLLYTYTLLIGDIHIVHWRHTHCSLETLLPPCIICPFLAIVFVPLPPCLNAVFHLSHYDARPRPLLPALHHKTVPEDLHVFHISLRACSTHTAKTQTNSQNHNVRDAAVPHSHVL